MRSSIAIASLCAAYAVASPIVKKGLEIAAPANEVVETHVETHVDVVTNVVMVTVTGEPVIVTVGAENTPAPVIVTVSATAQGYWQQSRPHGWSKSPAAPAPAAILDSQSVVVVTETQAASIEAPAPTSTSQSVVVVTEIQAASTEAPATTSVAPVTTQAAQAAPVIAPASSSAAPVASATDALGPSAVSSHNDARASHQVSPMVWNQTLADLAVQDVNCTAFGHDKSAGGGGYGQNLAVVGDSNSGAHTSETALADAIKLWYAEESFFGPWYGVAEPKPQNETKHFTQMVWKDSLQVGCFVKTCGTDNSIYPGIYAWYSICNYYPAGNALDGYASNVFP